MILSLQSFRSVSPDLHQCKKKLLKLHGRLYMNLNLNKSDIISTDKDLGLRIEGFEIIK